MGIKDALQRVENRIHEACLRSGRDPREIQLMGVSKFHGSDEVAEAWDAGLRLFGENRVQEAAEKFPGFMETHAGCELHMIGTLQRNKVKAAVQLFHCIQSVDRVELITELGKHTAGREKPLPILLEMHTGEASKAGFPDLDSLSRGAEQVLECPGLVIRGLMTMAPYTDDTAVVRSSFKTLSAARDRLAERFPGCDWSCLSMGMSNDFEIAIEEGATLLRVGTMIFGDRV
ncbi:YggS family pyridoxal phosphate-dependent enzyme [Breznakiella homolactica]|uniref:Pyridoxal phosphate homeostasis protein n=1 Tax=Breznakiella homolactica TaxID=2798577 RepID=A0A7T7XKI7_9SPIR|nr:YggS family pyridoxal phosphate-dependent enzyme [Breznakiella homolactica]QQO08036.1 YggS family pyridoxal phosphate-dependent enzyme [Breznakiella homolactica]